MASDRILYVTAKDLAAEFHADPANAKATYTGRRVRVLLAAFDRPAPDRLEWRVRYYAAPRPPALIFELSDQAIPKPPCWVEGTCGDRADDGVDRGPKGYTFAVTLTDCRPAAPPASEP